MSWTRLPKARKAGKPYNGKPASQPRSIVATVCSLPYRRTLHIDHPRYWLGISPIPKFYVEVAACWAAARIIGD